MAFEAIKAEFSQLFQEMEPQPQDLRELYEMIREKLNELRATGMPVPDDLKMLEQKLDAAMMPEGNANDVAGDGFGDGDGGG